MKLIVFFILFCNSVVFCQNLVPNPSFEEVQDTISKFTKDNIEFTNKIDYWITPNIGSPDLITPLFDERYIKPPSPHTGSNMVGIQFNENHWIEYIGVQLNKPLIPNRTYYVEYWIRKSYTLNPNMNHDNVMNKNFGILFSPNALNIPNSEIISGTPHINVDSQLPITYKEWVKVSEYFSPKIKYSHLYMGLFQGKDKAPETQMGYYVIDDILVKEVTDFELLEKQIKLPVGVIIPLKNIHFKSGTTDLNNLASKDMITKLSTYLKSNPSLRIRINGHTDSNGSERSNLSLSKQRAKAIAKHILQNGISKDRIEWKGFGERRPIADNISEEGRSKNRRVEFEIIE